MSLGVKSLSSTGMIIGAIFAALGLAIFMRLLSAHPTSQQAAITSNCSGRTAKMNNEFNIMNLNTSSKINTCAAATSNQRMYFTDMPVSVESALSAASEMATTLKQFASQQLSPIIIVEPTDDNGNPLDLNQLAKGANTQALNAYFIQLRELGVTDKMMGLWIPYPEPDQPDWKNMTEANFGNATNIYLASLRQAFATAKTGILLDSEAGNIERQTDVKNYVASVDKSLVDVAGLQGFPWPPSEDNGLASDENSAAVFLPAEMAIEIAKILGTKQILLNTGSYGSYVNGQGVLTFASVAGRAEALASIAQQSKILKSDGFDLTINIFQQNKLGTPEGIDWSYTEPSQSAQTTKYDDFVRQLIDSGANISLFGSIR